MNINRYRSYTIDLADWFTVRESLPVQVLVETQLEFPSTAANDNSFLRSHLWMFDKPQIHRLDRRLRIFIGFNLRILFTTSLTWKIETFLRDGWPIALLQIAWAPRVNKHLILDKQATRAAIWSNSQLYIISNLMETFSISASDGDRISPWSSRMASIYPHRSGSVRSRPSNSPAINLKEF